METQHPTIESSTIKRLDEGRRQAPAYYSEIDRLYANLVPPGMRVLELGCGTGRLLAGLRPASGLGVDIEEEKICAARQIHSGQPCLQFRSFDVETATWQGVEPFDYIVISDLVPLLTDVQKMLSRLHAVCCPTTRIIINSPSNLWRPLLRLATRLGRRVREVRFDWLSRTDLENLLYLADFETITSTERIMLPISIPLLAPLCNRFLAKLPGLRHLSLCVCLIARPRPLPVPAVTPTVSVMVPVRDEKGNIEELFLRTPPMGRWTELVIVEGHSTDGTVEEIERCMEVYKDRWPRVKFLRQQGKGKGQAVRQGFDACTGDILMILDSDLTMPPEELPKFYDAIVNRRGEFINGCRLVYQMGDKAMRFLNMIANHAFARLFTWLLGQPVKDTLCGTKVLWRKDYQKIAANRAYFGDFDPFGDFDLLFGAARLNLKIVDLPIRYRDRAYGKIKIKRWRHGLLLLRMSAVAYRKLKLN